MPLDRHQGHVTLDISKAAAAGAATHDDQDIYSTHRTSTNTTVKYTLTNIAGGADYTRWAEIITMTDSGIIEGSCFWHGWCQAINSVKMRIFIDGVQQAESDFLTAAHWHYALMGHKSVAVGDRSVGLAFHNYDGSQRTIYSISYCVFAGGVKTA